FLFSSRRRHTRSKRDWSSDVCSSDLMQIVSGNAFSHRHSAKRTSGNFFSPNCDTERIFMLQEIRLPIVGTKDGSERGFSSFRIRSEERRVGKVSTTSKLQEQTSKHIR